MDLLDPAKIRKDRKTSETETADRINKLAAEESRLVIVVNLAKNKAKIELAEIEKMNKEFMAEKKAERDQLTSEINGLRSQREQLLLPIDKIKKQAEETLKNAEAQFIIINQEKQKLMNKNEEIVELAERIQDCRYELNERDKFLKKREARMKTEQAGILASTNKLSGDWLKYHEAVNHLNSEIKKLDNMISRNEAMEASQEKRRQEQDKRELELNAKQTALESAYVALEQAKKHLGII